MRGIFRLIALKISNVAYIPLWEVSFELFNLEYIDVSIHLEGNNSVNIFLREPTPAIIGHPLLGNGSVNMPP
jgi:hypothetical protein